MIFDIVIDGQPFTPLRQINGLRLHVALVLRKEGSIFVNPEMASE